MKTALLVGTFLALPIGAVFLVLSWLDTNISEWFRHLPVIGALLNFWGSGLGMLLLFVLIIGISASSPTFNRYVARYTVERVPLIRGLWRWANKFAERERTQGFHTRVVILFEDFGEGSQRWRAGWVTGISLFSPPFPNRVLLSVTPIPSQGIGTDPRYLPPSDRIFVVEKPDRADVIAWAFSSGAMVPEQFQASNLIPWPAWIAHRAARNPEKLQQLLGQSSTTENPTDAS